MIDIKNLYIDGEEGLVLSLIMVKLEPTSTVEKESWRSTTTSVFSTKVVCKV